MAGKPPGTPRKFFAIEATLYDVTALVDEHGHITNPQTAEHDVVVGFYLAEYGTLKQAIAAMHELQELARRMRIGQHGAIGAEVVTQSPTRTRRRTRADTNDTKPVI